MNPSGHLKVIFSLLLWMFEGNLPLLTHLIYPRCAGELYFVTDRNNGFWNLYKWVFMSIKYLISLSLSISKSTVY